MEVVTTCTTYFNAKNHIMSGQFVRFSVPTTICSLNIINQPMFFFTQMRCIMTSNNRPLKYTKINSYAQIKGEQSCTYMLSAVNFVNTKFWQTYRSRNGHYLYPTDTLDWKTWPIHSTPTLKNITFLQKYRDK